MPYYAMLNSFSFKDTEYIQIDGTVSPGPDLPLKIYGHTILSINKTHSILIGGNSIDGYSNKTWFYNHSKKYWSPGPALMIARDFHTAGIIRDKQRNEETVVVVGGWSNGITILDSVEVLNLKSGHTWTPGLFTVPMVFLKIRIQIIKRIFLKGQICQNH